MLKKRNNLGKMLLIIMSASMLSSVSVFAEEKSNLNQNTTTTTNSIKETSASDFDFDKTTGTITKYKGSDISVIIPNEIDGVKVISIGNSAFTENENITSVEIPYGVVSIGSHSFYECSELTKLIIPDSVTNIYGGKSLPCNGEVVCYVKSEAVKQLLISKGRMQENKIINESLVSKNNFEFDKTTGTITKYKGLDSNVVIPSEIDGVKVKNIGVDAFYSNIDINSVEIPEGVTNIERGAFYECSELTKIIMPNSVTSIHNEKSLPCNREVVFYVKSEAVKQLLINKGGIKENKIILDNQSLSNGAKTTDATNANNSTQVAVSNETSNTFKWEKNSDGTWKLTKGGIAQGGWQQVNGKWYLMNSNGIMLTGWQPVNGKWYYLYSSGEMASNTTISGYTLGSDGAWI